MKTHRSSCALSMVVVIASAWGCRQEPPTELPVGGPREAKVKCSTPDCQPGYQDDGTGTCVDIDECLLENGGCDAQTTCTNTEGGRTCGPCPTGYEGMGDTFCMLPFIAGELVGRPTDSSITVNVVPGQDIEAYVEYGKESGKYRDSTCPTVSSDGIFETVVDGLKPDKRYYYRLRYRPVGSVADFRAGNEHSFQTQRNNGKSFTFAVQSDSHQGYASFHNPDLYAITMGNILAGNPDFLIDLGDTVSTDDAAETQASVRQKYLNQRNVFGILGHSVPVFLALGNHENEEGWNLDDKGADIANSLPILGANARKRYFLNPVPSCFYGGNDEPVPELDGDHLREDYYAFEWGRALFVIIDPYWYTTRQPFAGTMGGEQAGEVVGDRWDWTLGDRQYQWLKQTLENSNAKFKFVFAHQSTGGTADYVRAGALGAKYGEWGGYDIDGVTWAFDSHRPGWEMPIHQLFVKTNVSAFFHGHDHFYAQEVLDGIVYQEVPFAANTDYGTGFGSNAADYAGALQMLPNSGHLRVTVDTQETTVNYVRSFRPADTGTNGEVAHTYTIVPCNKRDTDGDGYKDCSNQDGCPGDPNKKKPGACGCGKPDVDSDSDGALDCNDACPSDPLKLAPGLCGCGRDDSADCDRFMVVRVGEVGSALTVDATKTFIEERRLDDGTLLNVMPLPRQASGANQPLTISGTLPVEGTLKRSVDGRYLTLAGFGAPPGRTFVSATPSSDVNRVVARIAADGTIDTTTAFTTAFSGTPPYSAANDRAVATSDGTSFWVAGSGMGNTGGIWYISFGSTSATQIIGQSGNNPGATRGIGIYGGQLFATNNAQTYFGVFKVGSGLPTTQAAAVKLPGMPTSGASPVDFAVLSRELEGAADTIYVADDRASGGGIQKWTFDGATWTLAYTISVGSGIGARHLLAVASPDAVTVLATTTAATNAIVKVVDQGASSVVTTLAAATGNDTAFRGLALPPVP